MKKSLTNFAFFHCSKSSKKRKMGNVVDKVTSPIKAMRGTKRKREDNDSDSNEEINDLLDKSLATPKRYYDRSLKTQSDG